MNIRPDRQLVLQMNILRLADTAPCLLCYDTESGQLTSRDAPNERLLLSLLVLFQYSNHSDTDTHHAHYALLPELQGHEIFLLFFPAYSVLPHQQPRHLLILRMSSWFENALLLHFLLSEVAYFQSHAGVYLYQYADEHQLKYSLMRHAGRIHSVFYPHFHAFYYACKAYHRYMLQPLLHQNNSCFRGQPAVYG